MKNLTPSLLGCGGIFAIIGIVLLLVFWDRVGADILSLGLWLMGAIALFWLLTYAYKKLK